LQRGCGGVVFYKVAIQGRSSTVGAFTKRWVIDKRRGRRQKINLLRKRYGAAKSEADKSAIIKKALLVSPQMSVEEFLGPIKQAAEA